MDTEKTFLYSQISPEAMKKMPQIMQELSEKDRKTAQEYVEATRHFQEIHNIYQMFLYNLNSLTENYTLMTSGALFLNGTPASSSEDYIAVNALVSNILASAKDLTESMDTYLKAHDNSIHRTYKAFAGNLYDGHFAYRFCVLLRNFTQHGHLAVSQDGNHYYFDVYNIVHKPHFKLKAPLKQELKRFNLSISQQFQDMARASLTLTLLEFTDCLMSLYEKFLVLIEPLLRESYTKAQQTINRYPDNLTSDKKFFFYSVIEDNESTAAHCFDVDGKPLELLEECQKEAVCEHEPHKALWESVQADISMKYN